MTGGAAHRALVVGSGHNGLVCACYLARAGWDVEVLEQSDKPGGGSRTDETIPGHRFNTHSAAHNIINMTSIPRELGLAEAGLEHREMDPFAIAVRADGRRVRFHRSVEATVASIAESDPGEARAYERFMADAIPLVELATLGLHGGGAPRELAGRALRRAPQLTGLVRRHGLGNLTADLLGSYGTLLRTHLDSDLTRGPVSAFAAHANAAPDAPGSAFFGYWQAAYHRYGQWHPVGGSQALTDALVNRLEHHGGRVRCNAPVARIDAPDGRVRTVVLEGGQRLAATTVVTALDPGVALLDLLHPRLAGPIARRLEAAPRSNVVQFVVHVATDRLPPYLDARDGDWNGLQSYVDTLDQLVDGFHAAADRRIEHPVPLYAFTPSALDDTLAPPGQHTTYLACPSAPFEVRGGWEGVVEATVEDMLSQVEERAPGFRDSITAVSTMTPTAMAEQLRWPGARPMYLDISLDRLGPLRPVPALAGHRTPVAGLYISGAGTAPVGGIAGSPGRAAAKAVLRDRG